MPKTKDETDVTFKAGDKSVTMTAEQLDRAATITENAALMQLEIERQVDELIINRAVDIYKCLRKNDGELNLSISVKVTETIQELAIVTRLSYSKEKVKVEAKNKIMLNQLRLPVE